MEFKSVVVDWKVLSVIGGIIFSSLAQIFMKQATSSDAYKAVWFLFLFGSMMSYFLSFVMYYFAIKSFPISKVSPVMTVGVVCLVVLFGMYSGEVVSYRHFLGIVCGFMSILLILA